MKWAIGYDNRTIVEANAFGLREIGGHNIDIPPASISTVERKAAFGGLSEVYPR
jgi:hypothetical protein